MTKLQERLELFWGAIVDSFSVDLKSHSIELILKTGVNKTVFVRFIDVYTFKFDHSAYGGYPEVLEPWDVIELTEFHFLPELKPKASHAPELHSSEFDFLLEFYRSRLLIKARSIEIDHSSLTGSNP